MDDASKFSAEDSRRIVYTLICQTVLFGGFPGKPAHLAKMCHCDIDSIRHLLAIYRDDLEEVGVGMLRFGCVDRLLEKLRHGDSESDAPIRKVSFDASAVLVTLDSNVDVWGAGLKLLCRNGESEQRMRRFLGKLVRDHGVTRVAQALRLIEERTPADPRSYLVGALKNMASQQIDDQIHLFAGAR